MGGCGRGRNVRVVGSRYPVFVQGRTTSPTPTHEQPSTEERRPGLSSFLPNSSHPFATSRPSRCSPQSSSVPSRPQPAGITCYSTLRDLALSSRGEDIFLPHSVLFFSSRDTHRSSCYSPTSRNPENEILRAVFLSLGHPSNSARVYARVCVRSLYLRSRGLLP